MNPGPLLKSMCVFKLFDNLCGEKLYCWENQKFGLYANLLGILVLLFEENSTGEYLKTLWGIENENLHFVGGIHVE